MQMSLEIDSLKRLWLRKKLYNYNLANITSGHGQYRQYREKLIHYPYKKA